MARFRRHKLAGLMRPERRDKGRVRTITEAAVARAIGPRTHAVRVHVPPSSSKVARLEAMTEAGLAMMFLRTLLIPVVMGAVLFASAGRLDLPAFWAYLAVLWLITGSVYTVLLRRDPALVAERLRPPSDRDRATRRLAFPFMGGHYVVAGLDAGRFGWTHAAPALHGAGFVLVVAGLSFACWTLLANPYASSAVRIQAERDQRVITTGPYRFVRHPMYSGVVLCSAGSGLALGSLWAGLLLVPVVAIFVRRTLLEDHMLMAELSGYADYARTVRARLIPGVF